MTLKKIRTATRPLEAGQTRPLRFTRRLRTFPFKLQERPGAPASFSAKRFSPHSRLKQLGELELEIIHAPQKTLGPALEWVYSELLRLTQENSPFRPGTYMHQHLWQGSRLIVVRKEGVPAGFSIATAKKLGKKHFLFINATFYGSEIRGAHLTPRVNLLHFWPLALRCFPRKFYVALRTQNPLVFAAVTARAPFYPRLGEATPEALREAGAALCAALNPDWRFDREAMVVRGGVARDAFDPARPRHHRSEINDYCDQHLDYERGDTFMMVAEMDFWGVCLTQLLTWYKAWRARRQTKQAAVPRPSTG